MSVDIRYGNGDWRGVDVQRFLTETIFPVCSPDIISAERPLREPVDLRHHTLLHDTGVTDWAEWLQAAGVSGIDVDRGPGFNHSHLVTAAAMNGDGIALGRGALVADAIESSLDVFQSLIVMGGLVIASAPPDENHPYGHGKA